MVYPRDYRTGWNYEKLCLYLERRYKQIKLENDGFVFAHYYISTVTTGASDSNPGTYAKPFLSFAPLLAMPANSLDGKVIAVERGSTPAPMDLAVLTASARITDYGDRLKPEPFFDCSAPIPANWTLYATGMWSITLTQGVDSKMFPNVFRNGLPIRKVESVAALSGKPNYTCTMLGLGTGTIQIIMNAPSDPGADGAAYRWSKYGIAICIAGRGAVIENMEAFGPAAQDGAFKAYGTNNLGGVRISGCKVTWSGRHAIYAGSGSSVSIVEDCILLGGANDIETGGALNVPGTANSIVFNTVDHTSAICISRRNIINGNGGVNWNAGGRNFTGPYGHDGVAGRPMVQFQSIDDVFIDVTQAYSVIATDHQVINPTFNAVDVAFFPATAGAVSKITNARGSRLDCLVQNIGAYTFNLVSRGNIYNIIDCGAGGNGFVRGKEGTSITNFDSEGDVFNVLGVRLANGARPLVALNTGSSLRFKNNIIGPALAPPLLYTFDLATGVTLSADNDNNIYPIGTSFRINATAYRGIPAWQAQTGGEAHSAYRDMPASDFSDDFNGSDTNLDNVAGWSQITGTAGSLQRKNNLLYGSITSGTPAVYKRGDVSSDSLFAQFVIKNLSSAGGPAVNILDGNNLRYIRVSGTAIQLMKDVAGVVALDNASSGQNPAIGDIAIVVIRKYTDPNTGVSSMRAWFILNGGMVTALSALSTTSMDAVRTCGAAARSVIADYCDDLKFGSAPLVA